MKLMIDWLLRLFQKTKPPLIDVKVRAFYDQEPTSPAPTYKAQIFNQDGIEVGSADFGVSPINDKVYVYEIEVEPEWRRQGYGAAFITYLHELYGLPVTPVHIVSAALGFWAKLRQRGRRKGLVITQEMGTEDLWSEHKRWPHLASDIERLKETISHRLWVLRQPYDVATSRGLEDWDRSAETSHSGDANI